MKIILNLATYENNPQSCHLQEGKSDEFVISLEVCHFQVGNLASTGVLALEIEHSRQIGRIEQVDHCH